MADRFDPSEFSRFKRAAPAGDAPLALLVRPQAAPAESEDDVQAQELATGMVDAPSTRPGQFDPAEFASFKGAAATVDLPETDALGNATGGAITVPQMARQVPAASPAEDGGPSVAADMVNSAGAGLIRGAAGLAGLPSMAVDALDAVGGMAARPVAKLIAKAYGGNTASERGEKTGSAFRPHEALSAENIVGVLQGDQPLYEPKTTAGHYARSAAEFVPGAGRKLAQVLAMGVAPGLLSEAAGQATKGTAAEPWARGGVGLLGGLAGGAAIAKRAPAGGGVLAEALEGIPVEAIENAAARMKASREVATPIPLTLGEALNKEAGGRAGRVSQIERVIANSGGEGARVLSDLYAARPGRVDDAARTVFGFAPPPAAPSLLGLDVQAAAKAGIAQTPEGQALAAAMDRAGPRVTAGQAGSVIQPELRAVRDGLEEARTVQAERDYRAAREAPEAVGIDRTMTVERPGELALQTPDGTRRGDLAFPPQPDGPPTLATVAPARPETPERAAGGKSLARFIAENGGIGVERGDVAAAGLDRFRQPGVSNLVRQDGKSIDGHWRERLVEEGYLPPDRDGGMARNVHDDILNLLQEEAAGRKVYPFDWMGRDGAPGFSAAHDEFAAAASTAQSQIRAALREADVDPRRADPGALDRATAALVRGDETDPLRAFEGAIMASREPVARPAAREVPTTVAEEIPAPRFGQVNPQPAVDAIDQQLRTAKGDVVGALESTRKDLYARTPDPVSGKRETDLSVEGLLHARERLDMRLADAVETGDRTKVRDLQIARATLDAELKKVPEVATADANFAAASKPLEQFAGNTPLARVTARDDLTGRMTMPVEQVPSAIAGAGAVREFVGRASATARQAYEGHLTTQILDQATAPERGLTAESLRRAMREHEDVLALLPDVRDRLAGVAMARDGLARVERLPLGRLAEVPETRAAIRALFPIQPLANGEQEIASAVGALARNNPTAARQLVRTHLETVFDEATQTQKGLPAQYGGAGFAAAVMGNAQQRKNMEAAIRALPDGDAIWPGMQRFFETLEATGYRPMKGSDTAFNTEILTRLRGGGPLAEAITGAASGATAGGAAGGPLGAAGGAMLGMKRSASDWWAGVRMGRNTEAAARLLTDPAALPDLRALAKSPEGSPNAALFAGRLATRAATGYQHGDTARR